MYTPTNLVNGDVLTAAHLNGVDDGIAANETAAVNLSACVADVETKLQAFSTEEE